MYDETSVRGKKICEIRFNLKNVKKKWDEERGKGVDEFAIKHELKSYSKENCFKTYLSPFSQVDFHHHRCLIFPEHL